MQEVNLDDREKCLKVFSIHSKNAEISLDKEDYLTADEELTRAIEFLTEDEDFEKANKIRERGEIKFKKGQIREAMKDFEVSELIFQNLVHEIEERKRKISNDKSFSFLDMICSETTEEEIDRERE